MRVAPTPAFELIPSVGNSCQGDIDSATVCCLSDCQSIQCCIDLNARLFDAVPKIKNWHPCRCQCRKHLGYGGILRLRFQNRQAPATCGAAIDVPWELAKPPPGIEELIRCPGANRFRK